MRTLWSEVHKRKLWRRLWVALAEAQVAAELVTPAQVEELRLHAEDIDIEAAHEIEAEIHHDLMAEVRVFAAQCPTAGGIIHLGATSMDIEDNADALRLRDALAVILKRLVTLLDVFCGKVEVYANTACMAYTHLQPAEPTTIGYRLAQYAQDLWGDWQEIKRVYEGIRGKGFKGAVGTSASYGELLQGSDVTPQMMEAHIMNALGLAAFPVATQTYPRKQDWLVLNALVGLAGSIYKFALDLRVLQSPPFGEWAEPFGKNQVGSSAMPFKRNPVQAEQLCSLARMVAALPPVAWNNAAHSVLERTLDDSANRRSILPEAFLAVDQMLQTMTRLVQNLHLDETAITHKLNLYGTFSALERVLMAAVRAGADRQDIHEILREHSMVAWQAIGQAGANPLVEQLCQDERILAYLNTEKIHHLMDASRYVGDAPQRASALVTLIRESLSIST